MVDQHNLMEMVRDVEDNVAKPSDIFVAERDDEPICGNVASRERTPTEGEHGVTQG